jgi:hypothetical protein
LRISRAALSLVLVTGACKRELVSIPAGPQELVIHGVLNPADTMQIVLIERTLTGAVATPIVLPYTTDEPIYSDWGVPERAATSQITAPDGSVILGTELTECYQVPPPLCRGNGAGVYKFLLRGSILVPGGKYAFRAVTTKGEVITAETIVPQTPLVSTTTAATFNRTTDTLSVSWSSAPRAPAYQVRVDNSFTGAWTSFTDSTRVALTGALRNPDEAQLALVFLPGFGQLLTVSAVDAIMYDYYRTSNNSFVGYGAVSRVKGALGVFGSAVTVARQNLTVTATRTRPIEGIWDARDPGTGSIYFTRTLSIYVESSATSRTGSDEITGNFYNSDPAFATTMTGTFKDGTLGLVLGTGFSGETLVAELRGDTLIGKYSKGAPALFVKR